MPSNSVYSLIIRFEVSERHINGEWNTKNSPALAAISEEMHYKTQPQIHRNHDFAAVAVMRNRLIYKMSAPVDKIQNADCKC